MLAGGQKGFGNCRARLIFWVGRNTAAGASGRTPGKIAEHVEGHARGRSTGIGRKSHEPIGQALGELMKGLAFSASMTRRWRSMRTVLTTPTWRSATGQSTSGKCQYSISRSDSA